MKVAVFASGSIGTYEASAGFARTLSENHDVIVIASPDFKNRIEPFEFISDGLPVKAWLNDEFKGGPDKHRLFSSVENKYLDRLNKCQNVELVISAIFSAGVAYAFAKHKNIPFRSFALFPGPFTRDEKYYDKDVISDVDLSGNQALDYWGHNKSENIVFKYTKCFYGVSNEIVSIQNTSDVNIQCINQHGCGSAGEVDETVLEYVKKHEPIYIGFGSMCVKRPEFWEAIYNFVKNSKHKVLLCGGWSDKMIPIELKSHKKVMYVKQCNHKSIFPYCKVVVHHGGSGTTHTVASLGKPSYILPVCIDQFYWGDKVQQLNVGYFKECVWDVTSLSQGVEHCMSFEVAHDCIQLAQRMQHESINISL